MNRLKALAKDKRVQIAAAAGAVLGLVALVRKGGSASAAETASGTPTTAGTGAAGGGYLGGYDSTATDVYNNLQTSLDNQLNEFRGSLGGLQDQLDKLGTKGTTPATPAPIKQKPVKKPPTAKKPISTPKVTPPAKKAGGTVITIPRGSTLSGLARKYGTSVPRLMALNPQIKNPNRIIAGARLRVK